MRTKTRLALCAAGCLIVAVASADARQQYRVAEGGAPLRGDALLTAATAAAKCAFRFYRVEVEFRSRATGEPVSSVHLAVFANGSDAEMPRLKSAPNDATSRDDGKLVRTLLFNTYSGPGFFSVDRCNAKVRKLKLVATHQNYQEKRISFKMVQHSTTATGATETIVVSPLLMDSLKP